MSNASKRKAKLLSVMAKRTWDIFEHDSGRLFFELLKIREKFDPYSREKIRLDPCAYCASTDHVLRTVDHVKPKSGGGSNSFSNLVSCCSDCNNKKGSMSLLEYLLKQAN